VNLQICEECGRGGYNHRRIGLMVDGRVEDEITLCRSSCADGSLAAIKIVFSSVADVARQRLHRAPAINREKT
jgi:hypothetical protein